MTPEEMLAEMRAMFTTLIVDHDVRIKALERQNSLKHILLSAVTSTIVAVVVAVVG